MMRLLASTAVAVCSLVGTSRAQMIRADAFGVFMADRATGIVAAGPSAQGPGGGLGIDVRFGRFGFWGSGLISKLSRTVPSGVPDTTGATPTVKESWTVNQLELRARFLVIAMIEAELSVTSRRLSPDFNGEEVGFFAFGVFSEFSLPSSAILWGRLGYLTGARFGGTGRSSFGAEVELGVEFALSAKISVMGRYQFQRLDRELTEPTEINTPLQYDIVRIGVAYRFGGDTGGDRNEQ